MDKNGTVTFAEWEKGMAKHPIYGFELLQNIEAFDNPGIASLAPLPTSLDEFHRFPIACEKDIYGNFYYLEGITASGVLFKNSSSVQSSLGNTWDLKIWKDYLWIRHSTLLSAYGPLSQGSNAQFFSGIKTGLSNNYWGKMVVGQDDVLYICDGNNIASATGVSAGGIGVAPTISSWNASALDLPEGQYARTIIEYGKWLMIGTQGGQYYSDIGNFRVARVYPWDRVSSSVQLPIIFNENGIQQMATHGSRLFVVAGTQGNVYEADSTNYRQIAQIPATKNNYLSFMEFTPNAIAVSPNGTLLIGNIATDINSKAGVWEVDINEKNSVILKHTISTGNVNSSNRLGVGFIYPNNYQNLRFGWRDDTTYGVDSTSSTLINNYGGKIKTSLVQVGTKASPKTFEHISFNLSDPLVSGQNIRISYRKNTTDDFTVIGTWGYSTIGSEISFEDKATISDAIYIQLLIELDQDVTAIYGSNINLINVILR